MPMKPVLAFLSDIFAYVQDKSQLNAEFAYDAPPSTPQTKLAKDATAVLSSPDLAAPPVAFISDATYVYALRALDTNDKEA
ncbi:ATPase [Aureococcus anophagefferens]|nr:ATPase [Aureococcus anophagefferens]